MRKSKRIQFGVYKGLYINQFLAFLNEKKKFLTASFPSLFSKSSLKKKKHKTCPSLRPLRLNLTTSTFHMTLWKASIIKKVNRK